MGLGDAAKAEAKARRGRKPATVVYDDDTLAMYNPKTWGQDDRDTSKAQFIAPPKESVKGAKYTDLDLSEEYDERRERVFKKGWKTPFAHNRRQRRRFTAKEAGDALASED